jgi:hypothetical protein
MSVAFDGPDWPDVLRRYHRVRRRRVTYQLSVLLALAVAGIASAYAFGHPIVDFGSAPKAGLRQVRDFGSLQVTAPRGMAPGVLPHQARRITTVRIDSKPHVLYVAPTKRGGFCYEWTRLGGGCRADRHDRFAARLDAGGLVGAHGLEVLEGSFFQANGDRLTLRFNDGASVDVPFIWVTAPIDAGFYLYRVPDAHRSAATRAVSLALYDKNGKLIDREPIQGGEPLVGPVAHVHGYSELMLPRDGIWSRSRQLFALRAPNGQRVGLWVMPKRGGGECFVTNSGSGCRPASLPPGFQIELGFYGDRLCCLVGRRIVRVEARFQDGARISLYPKEGYLIWPVPAEHYPLGHRLVALVGYDAAGHVVGRGKVPSPADQRGIYPCTKPKNLGYGVKQCP